MTQPFPVPNWPDPTQDSTLPRPFPEDDVEALFRRIAGVQVAWYSRPQRQMGLDGGYQAWLVLSMVASVGLGIDEYRTGPTLTTPPSPNPPALISRVAGQRVYTVGCKAESFDRRLHATDLIERVRMGIRTISAAAFLHQLGLAFVDFRAAVVLPDQFVDERLLRVAQLDIRFGMAQNLSPDGDDGGNFVTVNGGTQAPGTPITIVGTVVGK